MAEREQLRLRDCGCPENTGVAGINPAKHQAWHDLIEPLPDGTAATLEEANGRPSSNHRTKVDEQFAMIQAGHNWDEIKHRWNKGNAG